MHIVRLLTVVLAMKQSLQHLKVSWRSFDLIFHCFPIITRCFLYYIIKYFWCWISGWKPWYSYSTIFIYGCCVPWGIWPWSWNELNLHIWHLNKKYIYKYMYNYLCNRCLSPQSWVWISFRRGVLDTTSCDKVCQWLC
jgi:hypothetical protein